MKTVKELVEAYSFECPVNNLRGLQLSTSRGMRRVLRMSSEMRLVRGIPLKAYQSRSRNEINNEGVLAEADLEAAVPAGPHSRKVLA